LPGESDESRDFGESPIPGADGWPSPVGAGIKQAWQINAVKALARGRKGAIGMAVEKRNEAIAAFPAISAGTIEPNPTGGELRLDKDHSIRADWLVQ
jgi:hypothetical protein